MSFSLQGTTINLIEATNLCAELVQMLQSQRLDCLTFKKLHENAVQLAFEMDIDVNHPRTIGRQRHIKLSCANNVGILRRKFA